VFGIAELARSFSAEAIEELVAIMRAGDLPPRARIAAIDSILDRGLGKPMQPMQQQQIGADGQPISPSFNVIISEYPDPAPQEAADRLLSMQDHRPRKR
jgi:hypothetical protein